MTSKKELISQLDGKTSFSKSTLQKMTLGELKSLVGDKPVEKQKKQNKEPVVVAKDNKPRRREPVLREFSDSESENEDDEKQKEEQKEEQEEVVEPETQPVKPVVEPKQRGRPSKNKIKVPTLSVEAPKPTPPQSPQEKTLTTSELRKVLRKDYFKDYENDVKEILCEYKQGDLTVDGLISEYKLLRDDFINRLNNFLDTQRKLSDTQLDYIDSLLQRVADRVESEIN